MRQHECWHIKPANPNPIDTLFCNKNDMEIHVLIIFRKYPMIRPISVLKTGDSWGAWDDFKNLQDKYASNTNAVHVWNQQ